MIHSTVKQIHKPVTVSVIVIVTYNALYIIAGVVTGTQWVCWSSISTSTGVCYTVTL
jgi:hypothetical protein